MIEGTSFLKSNALHTIIELLIPSLKALPKATFHLLWDLIEESDYFSVVVVARFP